MSTQVQIVNAALTKIAAPRITSMSDATQAANLASALYDIIADEVMFEGEWTSTVTRQDLAALVDAPVSEFAYQYQLPSDPYCLKVLNVIEDLQGDKVFRIEGRTLVTDESPISIRYIARLTDPADYDEFLRKAIILKLAAEFALPLTGDKQLMAQMLQEYEIFKNQALAKNNQQGNNPKVRTDDLTIVR